MNTNLSNLSSYPIAIIGFGHWGKILFEHLKKNNKVKVKKVCELKKIIQNDLTKYELQQNQVTEDIKVVLNDKDIEIVFIATPARTHYELVKQCLQAGKNVFCEKPICLNTFEAKDLFQTAKKNNKFLFEDLIYNFNPSVNNIKNLIKSDQKRFGEIFYIRSTRVNCGPIRKDVNVVWDLAIHDILISNLLLSSLPESVSCYGTSINLKSPEDFASIHLTYGNNKTSNIFLSWFEAEKNRDFRIVAEKADIYFNDLDSENPIKIHYKNNYEGLKADRFWEIIKKNENKTPLESSLDYFLEKIEAKEVTCVEQTLSLNLCTILEAINLSLHEKRSIKINYQHLDLNP